MTTPTGVRLWNPETSGSGEQVYHFFTKNKRIKDAVYTYKKRNNITHPTVWRIDNTHTLPKDEQLIEKIKQNTNTVNTAKNYISAVNRFIADGGKITDLDSIKAYLKKLPLNVRETFLYAMIKVNKIEKNDKIVPELLALSKEAKGLISLDRQEKKIDYKDGDAKPKLTIADLKRIANAYPPDNKLYKFVAEFYTNEVPLRADTVVHITKDKTEKAMNLFYPSLNEIRLNKFKTIGTHGKKILDISPKLTKLMKIQFKNNDKSKWLLPSHFDITQPMAANTLSKIIITIFGVGVAEIRHITLTEGRKNLDNEGFVRLCSRMNTSPECGNLVYNDGYGGKSAPQTEQKRKGNMDETMTEDKRMYDSE